jgi:hypothetical protein
MAPAAPPKPAFEACDEVSVTVKCWDATTKPEPEAKYRIEYKEYPEVRDQPRAGFRETGRVFARVLVQAKTRERRDTNFLPKHK